MKRLNRSILPDPVRYPIKALFFGGGNFLRGFAAWMIHQMNQQGLFQGGILIVKPTPHGTYDQFRDQEGLFHVLIRGEQDGSNVTENHLVTAVQEVVNPYSDHAAFLKAAEIDSLQVVISNTTESGLTLTGDDRIEDAPPSSFPGKLTQFLWHRFRHFKGADSAGLVILPCELVRNNGYVLLQLLTELSENWELPEEFSNWLQRANTFCNTLVDRIVPGFPDRDAEAIYQELGCRDTLMVQAEPYYLWAIESPHKVSEVLPLGKAGFHVVFSRDISRYRDLKIRILNGAHTAMVPIGLLAGYQKVAEVMLDDDLLHFIDTTIRQEIHPGMSYPQEELDEYTRQVYDRFRNPFFDHFLSSIALHSISKFASRLLPSLLLYQELHDRPPKRITAILAALIYMYRGESKGISLPVKDSEAVTEYFQDLWKKLERNSLSRNQLASFILSKKVYWGQDLTRVPRLTNLVIDYLRLLEEKDVRALVARQT